MMKKVGIIAALLLIIGIVGALVTFKSSNIETTVLDEQILEMRDFTSVNVVADDANVQVASTKEEKVKVTLVGNDSTSLLTTEIENGVLHIQSKIKRQTFISLDLFARAKELTIHLPEETYDAIEVKSHNGRITLENIETKNIDLHADNGRVNVNNIQGESIYINSNNGRIEASNVIAEELDVSSDNGSIALTHIDAPIIGESNNGKVTLVQEHLQYQTELHSDNGKIEVKLKNKPQDALYDLAADNGRITVFGEDKWDIQVGNGKPLVKLSSDNGKITIGSE